jgi:hypothetical protein
MIRLSIASPTRAVQSPQAPGQTCTVANLPQLCLMKSCPFQHHRSHARPNFPIHDHYRIYLHHKLVITVAGMKMWRRMIIVKHLNVDSVKA